MNKTPHWSREALLKATKSFPDIDRGTTIILCANSQLGYYLPFCVYCLFADEPYMQSMWDHPPCVCHLMPNFKLLTGDLYES